MILCHGLGDHKDGFCLPELADSLCALGVSSLRFDFPGNGESEGTFRYGNMRDEVSMSPMQSPKSAPCCPVWHARCYTRVMLLHAACHSRDDAM